MPQVQTSISPDGTSYQQAGLGWASQSYAAPVGAASEVTIFQGAIAPKVTGLTFVSGGTTLVNAALGNAFYLMITDSTTTLGNPSNSVQGQVIRFRLTQGTGGNFTVAFGTAYDFGASGAPVLSTAAGKIDILGFEYVGMLSKWCFLGSSLGF